MGVEIGETESETVVAASSRNRVRDVQDVAFLSPNFFRRLRAAESESCEVARIFDMKRESNVFGFHSEHREIE